MAVAVYAFAVVTIVMWGTRINNIVADDAASPLDKAVDLTAAVVLVGLGVAVLVAALRRRALARAVGALAVVTVAMWAVRVPLILAHDHPVGFTVVHVLLAVASTALAAAAWRAVSRPAAAGRRGAVPAGRG